MIKKVMIPAGFLVVVIAAVVVYMGLHRNKEAATQINYSGIKGINLENVSPDYWNTDSVHRVAAAEDGYYYITDEDMLVYVDMDSKEEVPVCARPDCAHNSTDCDACLRGCVIYSIYYYNGRLYYMPIENGMAKLCSAAPDGGSREIIGELLPCDNSSSIHLAFLGDYVYAFDKGTHLGSDVEYTEQIIELSLKNGSRNVVYEATGKSISVANVKGFGDKVMFTVIESNKDDKGIIRVKSRGIFAYSQSGKNVSQITTEDVNDYYFDNNGDTFYYYVNGQGLYKSDINSEQTELIFKADKYCDFCNVSLDNRYIYLNNGMYCNYFHSIIGNEEKKYVVLDKEGKLINEIPCPEALDMLFGDERYLFCINMGEDRLMYIDKQNIETETEWREVFSEPVYLLDWKNVGK